MRNLTPAELDALTDGAGFLRVGPKQAPGRRHPRAPRRTRRQRSSPRSPLGIRPSPTRSARPGSALLAELRGAAPEAALDAALAELAAAGRAVREGGMWRLPEHRPRLTNADEKLWERVRPLLAAAELRPPRVREVAAALALEPEAVERFLHRAERLGRVAKVADNRFFLPETLARLAEIARDLADETPEGSLHRGGVQGPLRRRPQSDDPNSRIS